jgi:hypothetical protein
MTMSDIPFNTPDGPKSYISEEQQKLYELGMAGHLWTITVMFTVDGDTKLETHRNLTNPQVMALRKALFQYGVLYPMGNSHWKIINPVDIYVDLYRQTGYFSG